MARLTGYLLMHEAVRVELRRLAGFTEEVAAGCRHAGPAQLAALHAHVDDVLDVVHHHHVGEDHYLWPLLRELVDPADDRLDALSADHDTLDGLMVRLRTATAQVAQNAQAYGTRADAGELADAAGALRDHMERHLAEEEALVVPIVGEQVTDQEYHRMEKRMQRDSKVKMSFVLPWLAAADPARMAEVAAELGPVFRPLLAATRGRHHRRVVTAYGQLVVDPGPVTLRGEAVITIPAPVEEVYEAVSDILRMARYSPENYRCEWLDGATGPRVGARFRGWNQFRGTRWSRECEIVTAEPGVAYAFRTVRTATKQDSTLWRFDLRPTSGGTVLTQTFELSGSPLVMAFERISRRDTSTPTAMRQTLVRLRDDVAARAGSHDTIFTRAPKPSETTQPGRAA